MKSTNLLRLCVVCALAIFAIATADSANARLFGGCHGGLFRNHGNDCCCEEPACCEAEPVCCEAEPVCCEPEPVCCEPEPVCCEPEPCCEVETCCEPEPCCRRHHRLFHRLRNRGGCCEAEPACGCGC